ncbi:dilute domain-containing protein [[Candida] railenensis]|uniref:Dilute domain-containing protein n=1 Tax=[Candida] railenensis TaxID=45579 RepID=A0A9P0QMJ3_9ASCO|nr:dilute domain-containing protein [[Candida] railenensis]
MDAWTLTSGTSVLANASSVISTATTLASDPYFQKVLASQKSLIVDNQEVIAKFILASCNEDMSELQSIVADSPELIDNLSATGITPLIYGIFFNHLPVLEFLLDHSADPDLSDTAIANYTPIMWAVYLNRLDIVKLLLNHQADPYLCPDEVNSPKKNAISLVYPEKTEMYQYFKSHNIFRDGDLSPTSEDFGDDYYNQIDNEIDDDLSNQIKLQSITGTNIIAESDLDVQEKEREKIDSYVEERTLSEDPILFALPEFDYQKLQADQYLEFDDSDIPTLLDYIFSLRTSKTGTIQHETKVPAAIVFQLLRYSHMKAESIESTEFLFDYFITRLRTVTNTKSGVFTSGGDNSNKIGQGQQSQSQQTGDIVLLSYWLSVIQFLHFYLCKNGLYKNYPKFLQELVNTVQSLIATLSFSINSRLNLLIDECMLDFTSLIDVSNTLYAKDWNLFKTKKKHPNTYDDIFNMLYPPNEREMMKPSPLRFVQVLGALDYVLKLHQVDNILKSQTFSQVFYCINCTIFNRIISQSKYCSRGKAIQIRLNISTVEDWLRGHNFKIQAPDSDSGLKSLLPADYNSSFLINLLQAPKGSAKDANDPHFLSFYYTSLFHIGKLQLQPTIELLQWLQCMSTLRDEDSLVGTINQFDSLNYYQIVKTMTKLYKYEVEEVKIPKQLVNFMKRLQAEQGENQVGNSKSHYMTQTSFLSKELYIYLNPNFVFPVALPTLQELINNYGSGLGGVRIYRAKKYQPSIPIDVLDDVEELLAKNKSDRDRTFEQQEYNEDGEEDYDEAGHSEAEADTEENDGISQGTDGISKAHSSNNVVHNDDKAESNTESKADVKPFKSDSLFKEVQLPSSLAHRTWGDDDIDANPW